MPEISEQTLFFLRDAIRDKVQALFDDPVGYVGSPHDLPHQKEIGDELREALEELESCAEDAGLSWKALIIEEATEYELKRVLGYLGHNTKVIPI
jgi:hypothetical protein